MNTDEVLEKVPNGPLWLTILDPAGNEDVSAVPLYPLGPINPESMLAQQGKAAVSLGWDDGSNRVSYWQVDSVEEDGPRIRLIGPDGTAILTRRAVEEPNE